MISELRNESIKCGQHPGQYLYFFQIARWLEALHDIDLIGIYSYPSVNDQITQELTSSYTKSAFLSVKVQLMSPKYFKRSLKVLYLPTFLFTFHYHVINIDFDRAPYFIPEHLCHHPLICGPSIFKSKRHHGVVVVRIRGDECFFSWSSGARAI